MELLPSHEALPDCPLLSHHHVHAIRARKKETACPSVLSRPALPPSWSNRCTMHTSPSRGHPQDTGPPAIPAAVWVGLLWVTRPEVAPGVTGAYSPLAPSPPLPPLPSRLPTTAAAWQPTEEVALTKVVLFDRNPVRPSSSPAARRPSPSAAAHPPPPTCNLCTRYTSPGTTNAPRSTQSRNHALTEAQHDSCAAVTGIYMCSASSAGRPGIRAPPELYILGESGLVPKCFGYG